MSQGSASSPQSNNHLTKKVEPAQPVWEPNVDVYVADQCIVIKAEIAGLQRDQLEVLIEGERIIRIRGYRTDICRPPGCRFLMMNISYGPFERVVELPPGYDLTMAKAVYVNGFLQISVPPLPNTTPKNRKTKKSPTKK
jgi:HSP20 family protein